MRGRDDRREEVVLGRRPMNGPAADVCGGRCFQDDLILGRRRGAICRRGAAARPACDERTENEEQRKPCNEGYCDV